MSQPRTKPWEVSSGTSAAAAASGQPTQVSSTGTDSSPNIAATSQLDSSVMASDTPELPSKPTSLSGPQASGLSSTSSYSPYGANSYNNSYGGLGSSYGSTYGSYGLGGASTYGGYGMGGMGGYGGGYGMGGYGMGGYGGRYGPGSYGNNNVLGNNAFTQNTELTFQLIESIIGAVGGFAQMLEATYMATHSSFFTMISVLEQFSHLKNALGSLLGIFTLITYAKKLLAKVTGNKDYLKINLKEFKKFEKKQLKLNKSSANSAKGSRISLKPLILFVAAIFGFPYLLKKLITHLSMIQQQQQQQQRSLSAFDPNSLEFAKTLYDFNPEDKSVELELKKGDLVAILSRTDPLSGQDSKWWKCRSRDGRIGFVPYNFLQVIKREVKRSEGVVNGMVDEFKSGV